MRWPIGIGSGIVQHLRARAGRLWPQRSLDQQIRALEVATARLEAQRVRLRALAARAQQLSLDPHPGQTCAEAMQALAAQARASMPPDQA